MSVEERGIIALQRAGGASITAIAARLGRSRATVGKALKTRDVEELRASARRILFGNLDEFAHDFVRASQEAAKKGKHEAALDALLHLGVVEPVATGGPAVQIAIGIAAPGCPSPEAVVSLPPKTTPDGD